ncbi:MAG: glycosyltransferase [Verrucomicrobiota bacterium]|jgi:glycosyltransferase involved in cell wall biosynthesis|nr:glycosyltransferase [Verrucomicrobiota bacterium]
MKISGFTFLRNADRLQFPFVESIRSALPLVDEFVVALGPCDDRTEQMLRAMEEPKLRILPTTWNENLDARHRVKGFVYGQQKSMALFNCTGDWALYLEGDEVLHEEDLPRIRAAMERHLDNPRMEALYFRYLHFYGNQNTVASSPRWYRREVRAVRNNLPIWGPKGLFFSVVEDYKHMRYPRAAFADATVYHYGWVRPEEKYNEKWKETFRGFTRKPFQYLNYADIDPNVLQPFTGTHPKAIQAWLPPAKGLFQANPNYALSRRERKHRWMMQVEKWLGVDWSRKHFIQAD